MTVRTTVLALVAAAVLPLGAASAAEGPEPPPLPELAGDPASPEIPPLPDISGSGAPDVPPLSAIGGDAMEIPPLPDAAAVPPLPDVPEVPGLSEGAGLPEGEESHGFSEFLEDELARLPFPLRGFVDMRAGPRIRNDPNVSDSFTLGETRLQLESDPHWEGAQFGLKADILYDAVLNQGRLEIRDANVAFSPFSWMDVKAGRQVLTWGTGDLLFINDLFPKDYISFFIGRDVEYLKAPSDALKLSFFTDLANLDVVYTPQFDPDIFPTGKRLSYWNPVLGAKAGNAARLRVEDRDEWFTEDEIALRLYRSFGSYEVAAYGYEGYWKSPQGFNPMSGRFTFPRLRAVGASARGPVAGGIGNVEVGHYDSRDDSSGTNPLIANSEWRFLAGYSRDLPQIAQDFTLGVQYYLEHMEDYGAYKRTLPAGTKSRDKDRHLLTLRLTKLLLNQDLQLSFFGFFGVTDQDVYLRPYVSYKITDNWQVDGGANIFIGDNAYTPFGQFEDNSNVFAGVRYSF